ncbi:MULTISPECIES: flagella basal body P-ring formation protein FlgA [Sphingomonas]|jgi:flagella basal body P-ring formation protein FlgA|uniref:Flagella basal body P-ring formation protein FlgA n=1 Tax=Sphingomonas echinoides TaxID=59803 RepID=A0ABU4PIT2_9SPHN|nr:flagella basal body P-ring formation protein FlgA [Sphingomonas echinoides]MDX5983334.1 flagella basal body P-ring formation protein FlgA [Sphingomonas echinoides]
MLRHLPLVLIAVASPAAAAPAFQDTATLDRAVAAFAGKAIGEEGGARTPVDSRLKLAACPMVSMAWRSETHDAVVVTCTGPQWRLFVPIRTPVVAPKGAAPLVITPSEVAPLRPVYVIKRGDPVTISAGSPGFSITREGIAAGDAVAGGRFLVKIDSARAPIQAVAIANGRATLPGWTE